MNTPGYDPGVHIQSGANNHKTTGYPPQQTEAPGLSSTACRANHKTSSQYKQQNWPWSTRVMCTDGQPAKAL